MPSVAPGGWAPLGQGCTSGPGTFLNTLWGFRPSLHTGPQACVSQPRSVGHGHHVLSGPGQYSPVGRTSLHGPGHTPPSCLLPCPIGPEPRQPRRAGQGWATLHPDPVPHRSAHTGHVRGSAHNAHAHAHTHHFCGPVGPPGPFWTPGPAAALAPLELAWAPGQPEGPGLVPGSGTPVQRSGLLGRVPWAVAPAGHPCSVHPLPPSGRREAESAPGVLVRASAHPLCSRLLAGGIQAAEQSWGRAPGTLQPTAPPTVPTVWFLS